MRIDVSRGAMKVCWGLMCGLFLLASPVCSQAVWPNKPIKIIIPFPPGDSIDITARMIGPKLTEMWGQPVIVENIPGGSGQVGMAALARATPDGHTLLVTIAGTHVLRGFLTGQMPVLAIDLCFVLLFLGATFAVSPLLGAITALAVPVLVGASLAGHRAQRRLADENFQAMSAKSSTLAETVANAGTIKALGLEALEVR